LLGVELPAVQKGLQLRKLIQMNRLRDLSRLGDPCKTTDGRHSLAWKDPLYRSFGGYAGNLGAG